ncbi:hypothetical protein M407DRAFT_31715 [Tulasnella calospora MUT 4182]|uniref:BTB domain-containing protein n=1 Tax=Tulasnella calospora MUT 4182 TaxID=1051891 RepID=A0A0C3Q614_9AGAM|nr:hypothetical protein M407DRAFT_31715 [Tulasnella calospora MUT 4182]
MESDSELDYLAGVTSEFKTKDTRIPVTIGGARYRQDPDHWYDDGNVILIAGETAFRFFKSILSKRSQVMKDMLDLSQRTTINRTHFEGVPAVQLDDNPRYFSLLLDAILPRDSANHPISEKLGPGSLIGVARIAKKYQVNDVVARAGSILENILPTKQQPGKKIFAWTGSYAIPRCVHIINWARFCGLPQFLPLPLYFLATNEWDFESEDGDIETLKVFHRLSPQDQLRIHRGRVNLQALMAQIGIPEWRKECRNHGCGMGQYGPRWKSSTGTRRRTLFLHPLEELENRESGYMFHDLCSGCSEAFAVSNRAMKNQVLDELDSCFDLDDEESKLGGCP